MLPIGWYVPSNYFLHDPTDRHRPSGRDNVVDDGPHYGEKLFFSHRAGSAEMR
jgi:hypothetical protein